ncbi:hypothetical protein OJ593_03645 [Streptococcus anginosus]|uniref:hypothetical protein n=1 Tax=Streptococcus anginosus TaxID=1328 RepID=UPI0021F8C37C|nr:hypothetical protein [Streptococcus anginosus]MCW1059645.1 hypothetical protein [Streptococcus anginosus]
MKQVKPTDEKSEVKIGKTIYIVQREFVGKCSLQELLERLILAKNKAQKTGLLGWFEVSCPWVIGVIERRHLWTQAH